MISPYYGCHVGKIRILLIGKNGKEKQLVKKYLEGYATKKVEVLTSAVLETVEDKTQIDFVVLCVTSNKDSLKLLKKWFYEHIVSFEYFIGRTCVIHAFRGNIEYPLKVYKLCKKFQVPIFGYDLDDPESESHCFLCLKAFCFTKRISNINLISESS